MRIRNVFAVVSLLGPAGAIGAQGTSPAGCDAVAPMSPGARPAPLRALGVSVAVLDSGALTSLAGRTLSEALAARVPGVSVLRSSGVAGTGSRVYMRGQSGILRTQQPLLFIDGIRVNGELHSLGLATGGQSPSRLDDVPLDRIACVHVLRGPAATAEYGTDAAGGVIHVTTRDAAQDSARLATYVESGATADAGDYPANFGSTTGCSRARAALGLCVAGTPRSWSPIRADSPFRRGPLAQLGARWTMVASERVSAAISGSGAINDGALRNNDHRRYALGGSAAFAPDSSVSVQARLWAFGGSTQLPYVGSLSLSVLNSAMLGNSIDDPVLRGYRLFPRDLLQLFAIDQNTRRLGGVVNAAWTPIRWLAASALVGREDSRVDDDTDAPNVRLLSNGDILVDPTPTVSWARNRTQRSTATVTIAGTYGPAGFRATTSLAGHYFAATSRVESRSFLVGREETPLFASWRRWDGDARGVSVRQSLAWRDRRFIEAGVRHDRLDYVVPLRDPTFAFVNAAWDVGAESFFPRNGVFSSLRLRAAYGEGGDQRPYEAAVEVLFSVPPGTPDDSGEPRVERSEETEGGLDLGLFSDRVRIAATGFSKRTFDALHVVPLPPGIGTPPSTVRGTASWRTRGVEVSARGELIDRASLRASIGLTYTSLRNEVTSLGGSPPLVTTTSRIMPGYPLGGFWARPYTFADANGDGVIVPVEVTASAEARYMGSPVPTRELGVLPTVGIGRAVTIAALFDHRGGFRRYNQTGSIRCSTVCAALYDDASLAEQARSVGRADALGGWIEDASFVRLREVSVVWTLPASFGRRLGARSAAVTLAGRNLATWTSYSGLDPEGSLDGQSGAEAPDFFTLPLSRTFAVRLDARW